MSRVTEYALLTVMLIANASVASAGACEYCGYQNENQGHVRQEHYNVIGYGAQAAQEGYQDGLKDGRIDSQGGQSYRARQSERYEHAGSGHALGSDNKNHWKRQYRSAYERGYERGYSAVANLNFGGSRDPSSRKSVSLRQAAQTGYHDGVRDGQSDRHGRQGYRATQTESYKRAEHAYNSRYGRRDDYKQRYRASYEKGYKRGYGSNERGDLSPR